MLAGGRRPPCTNQPAAGAWQPSSDEVADDAAEAAEKSKGMIELVGWKQMLPRVRLGARRGGQVLPQTWELDCVVRDTLRIWLAGVFRGNAPQFLKK